MFGIVNDPLARLTEDAVDQLIRIADELGHKILIIGPDCDMDSEEMRRIVESARFEIFQQPSLERINLKEFKHQQGSGPRNRWGALK